MNPEIREFCRQVRELRNEGNPFSRQDAADGRPAACETDWKLAKK
jgi:hypothetical protein